MQSLLEQHNPAWIIEFDSLRDALSTELAAFQPIDIEHVGSTAIPGLCAKPILDIDIVLKDISLLSSITKKLESLGYRSKGDQGIEGRFAFKQESLLVPITQHKKKWQEHHLYVCYADSLALRNHLIFRNALLKDEKLTSAYAQIKISIAQEKGMNREEYTRRKTEFILSVLSDGGLNQNEIAAIRKANR